MRLKEDRIQFLCQKILQALRSKNLITLVKTELEVLKRMEHIFAEDLKVEDRINQEAEKLLNAYAAKMGVNFDREKMFQLIKKQLIKDKNVIV